MESYEYDQEDYENDYGHQPSLEDPEPKPPDHIQYTPISKKWYEGEEVQNRNYHSEKYDYEESIYGEGSEQEALEFEGAYRRKSQHQDYYEEDPYDGYLEPEPPDPYRGEADHTNWSKEEESHSWHEKEATPYAWGRRELEPNSDLYHLQQHKCYELEAEDHEEMQFNTKRPTWSHHSTPKLQPYAFSGKRSYLEWETNMDDWFYYHYIREEERMGYAIDQLKGEAYKWWLQEKEACVFYKERSITTWEHLKKLLRDEYVPKNKVPTKELPKRKPATSTSSTPHKPVNKPVAQTRGTSLNSKDKRFMEALAVKMEQLIDSTLTTLRPGFQPKGDQRRFSKEDREQPRQSSIKTSTPTELSSHQCKPPRRHIQGPKAEEASVHYVGQMAKSSLNSQKRSNSSRDKAKLACSSDDQGSLQQTQNQLDQQKIVDDLEKQILKALKALELSQKKSTALQAFSEPFATNQEPSCSKERPVVQRTKNDQPLLISKDANAKTMVLEESAKSNTKEEEEISESMQIGDQHETPSAKEELLGVRTPCEVKSPRRKSTLNIDLELPTSHEPKTIPKSLSHDYPKHCKETNSLNAKPSLFILVSTDEKKRFGLDKVKEFRVSRNVFDKVILTFETFELEKISDLNQFMCSELDSSLGNSLSFKMSNLFRTKAEFAYLRTISKQLLENVMCVTNPISTSCELELNDHGFDNFYAKLVYPNMFANSIRSLFALCSKETLSGNLYLNASLIYELVYPLIFDHTDIILLSLSKEPNAGFEATLKRKRRTYKREEDKRFNPPDLGQDKHQTISFFYSIKEAPPDATSNSKPSLNRFRGMSISIHNSMNTNLFFVHVDCSDLRTNPFEEGGDDMILTNSQEMRHEPEIEPAPNWQDLKNSTNKREDELQGATQDALLTPRIKELKGVHWKSAQYHNPTIDPRPKVLDPRPRTLDHRPPDHSTIDHPTMVDHFWPFVSVIIRISQGERPELEHQKVNREDKELEATDLKNEPFSPMTRSRTKELKEVIGRKLQVTDPPRAKPGPFVLIQA